MRSAFLRVTLYVGLVVWACATPVAAAPGACDGRVYHQFDFWLGRWAVTEQGKPAGTNQIDRLLEGCALLENWVGVGSSRGHSLNFYDATRGVWQQTWIDNSGAALNLTGHFVQDRMVLTGESVDPKSHAKVIDRITWTPRSDGSVRQVWDRSVNQGQKWTIVFDGVYRRK